MQSLSLIPEKLYNSEEVAELLRVSLRTVQRLLQANSLKSFKIHGQYRIKGLDLLSYLDSVRRDSEAQAESRRQRPADLLATLSVPPLALELSPEWAQAIQNSLSPENEGEQAEASGFLAKLQSLRQAISQELGFILPGIRIHDQANLKGDSYRILVHGASIAEGQLNPQQRYQLRPAPPQANEKPLARLPQCYAAVSSESEGLDGSELLLQHLGGLVKAFAHEILSREEVFVMLENLRKTHPVVLDELLSLDAPTPGKLTIGQFTRILKELLEEQVSIRPLALICESLADGLDQGLKGAELREKVRQGLSRSICARLADAQGRLKVLTLSQTTENAFRQAQAKPGPETQALARSLQEKLLEQVAQSQILLCAPDLRRSLFEILARNFSAWKVISTAEIDRLYWLESVAELDLK
ncbi:hypothetical protein COW36_02285 [bacterium (Candidatus Blackallbacteria) CG17_big_fil_post_rev_8_21_14_2_50_48_46]|uniref:Helix-turn-helix domain-containing protein n=1 Tax=bacterium (Candidatus Blackallbacteria) CG17_big_fil_post_rev_8_21_14_2_50_48_46 TaxID=2014261 RepID=A0A2M7G9Y4_9BACT|nr:MAG: hypothetical protein COW64_13185 [bacterium (Candidatus Blackallbacteria) CG18_big_fil_WC_8_21_14_2_50_49_26]PIW18959.1 MAG: hypothetical protein COW36_02285 [bacterium (Candidatus Blackallbacteria) CG17_big_fil_post_rev_8_21_14_2_50_48_46]PIW44673.1 MAG: hypothetical protein COW20_23830 [bacterium (Candidatus Blackallbacteria) CG13_big_fil_rev_8_21_14_2_50_49_14]